MNVPGRFTLWVMPSSARRRPVEEPAWWTVKRQCMAADAVKDEAGRVALRLRHRKETLAVSRVYADLFKAM